jgi:hypothetical protein
MVRCLLQLQYGRLSDAVKEFGATQSQVSRALADGKGWVARHISHTLGVPHDDLWDLAPYQRRSGQWWWHLERLLKARRRLMKAQRFTG